ncbi:MAG: PAS domain-containing protein [Isosphaeraceae bacterium]
MSDKTKVLLRYGVAVTLTSLAILLRWLLDPWLGNHLPFVTLFGAIAVTVWIGGYGPALIAVALGYLGCDWFLIEPRGVIGLSETRGIVALAAYLVSAGTIVAFGEVMHGARRQAESSRARLEQEAVHRREAEDRFRLACEAVNGIIYEYDCRTGRVERTRGLFEVLGYRPEEVPPTADWWMEQLHPEDRPSWQGKLKGTTGNPVVSEYRVRHRDGRWLYVEDRAVLFRDGDGEPVRMVGCTVDVSERRLAVEALSRNQERLRRLYDADLIGVMTVMEDGRILDANDAFLAMLGYTRDDLRAGPLNWRAMTPPDALASELEMVKRNPPRDGKVVPYEKEFLHKDGHRVPVLLGGKFLHGDSGEDICFVLDITDRKRAEEDLARSRRLFEQIARMTPDLVYVYDLAQSRNVYVNDGVRRVLGYSPEQIADFGPPLGQALIHPEDIVEAMQGSRRFDELAENEVYDHEMRMRHSNGEYRWLHCRETVFERDREGRPTQIIGTAQDVTEKKRVDQELRCRVEEVERLMEFLPIAVIRAEDPECRHVIGNPAAHRLLGVPERDNLSKTPPPGEPQPPYRTLQHGIEVSPDRLPMQYACRHGVEVRDAEYEIVDQGGRSRHIYCYATPLFDGPGRVRGCVFAALDISDRKRAEEALRDREEQYRFLVNMVPAFVWSSDPAGTTDFQSDRWYEYTGLPREGGQSEDWRTVVHPDDVSEAVEKWTRSVRTGEPYRAEYRLKRASDGEYRWWLAEAMPLRDRQGRIARWFGVCADIHERRLAEHELREADRRKDEFLATLAHELRNPLAPLRNGLQIMRLAAHDRAAVEEARTMMERQLHHFVRLVDDLLDLSRISRGKLTLNKERIDLASVVGSAVEACDLLIRQSDHELVVTLPDEPVYVDADRTRLAQALCNLLTNAAKYSDRGSRIWLAAERRGDDAVIHVRDTGVGIPPEMLSQVFQMFTQVDRSLERSQGGLGIGLSIVKRLVEMHGGTVEARSEGQGMGSEFIVRLPVVLSLLQEPGPGDSLAQARSMARHRILVVDDNVDAAASLGTMLTLMGSDVRIAHDGLEAVAAATEYRPDLILLDIGMPRMSGYDVCRTIREQPWGNQVVMVALTGWGQDDDKRRSFEAGFDHHLVKPIDPDVLEGLLDQLQQMTA